jgi:peptide/nickel transport system permease protein
MSIKSTLSQQAAWKRLKKNKGAIAGLIIIVLAIFTAIFSYFIALIHHRTQTGYS